MSVEEALGAELTADYKLCSAKTEVVGFDGATQTWSLRVHYGNTRYVGCVGSGGGGRVDLSSQNLILKLQHASNPEKSGVGYKYTCDATYQWCRCMTHPTEFGQTATDEDGGWGFWHVY